MLQRNAEILFYSVRKKVSPPATSLDVVLTLTYILVFPILPSTIVPLLLSISECDPGEHGLTIPFSELEHSLAQDYDEDRHYPYYLSSRTCGPNYYPGSS